MAVIVRRGTAQVPGAIGLYVYHTPKSCQPKPVQFGACGVGNMTVGRLRCSWDGEGSLKQLHGLGLRYRSAADTTRGMVWYRRPGGSPVFGGRKLKWSQVTHEVISGAPFWP